MRKIDAVTISLVLVLAACSKPTPGRSDNGAAVNSAGNATAPAANASSTAAAPQPGSASAAGPEVKLNPGQWETVAQITRTGLPPNLPPQVAEKMKSQTVTSRHCLSPEKAAHPGAAFLAGAPAKACTNNIVMAGGRISGSMVCKDPRGGTSTFALDGSYGGDAIDMTMKMSVAQGGQSMTMESHSKGHRVGACPAGAKDD